MHTDEFVRPRSTSGPPPPARQLFLEGYSKDFASTATYDSFWRFELDKLSDYAEEL